MLRTLVEADVTERSEKHGYQIHDGTAPFRDLVSALKEDTSDRDEPRSKRADPAKRRSPNS